MFGRVGADVGRDQGVHEGRPGRGGLPDHDAGLGPGRGVGLVPDPGDDGSVTGQRLVDEVRLVVRAVLIRARPVQVEALRARTSSRPSRR